jgi:hypothetical protein
MEESMKQDEQAVSRPESSAKEQAEHHEFEIQIDRTHYKVTLRHMTGLQLRHVPKPPIGPDRDLFEVVPGGSDRKIGNEQVVEIRNGLRFFTAPAQINPGITNRLQEDSVATVQ